MCDKRKSQNVRFYDRKMKEKFEKNGIILNKRYRKTYN